MAHTVIQVRNAGYVVHINNTTGEYMWASTDFVPAPVQVGDYVEITASASRPELVGRRGYLIAIQGIRFVVSLGLQGERAFTTAPNLKSVDAAFDTAKPVEEVKKTYAFTEADIAEIRKGLMDGSTEDAREAAWELTQEKLYPTETKTYTISITDRDPDGTLNSILNRFDTVERA